MLSQHTSHQHISFEAGQSTQPRENVPLPAARGTADIILQNPQPTTDPLKGSLPGDLTYTDYPLKQRSQVFTYSAQGGL